MAVPPTGPAGLGAELRPLGFGTSPTGIAAPAQTFIFDAGGNTSQSGQIPSGGGFGSIINTGGIGSTGTQQTPLTLEEQIAELIKPEQDGNTGDPSDVDTQDVSTMSISDLQAGIDHLDVFSTIAPAPLSFAMQIAKQVMKSQLDTMANTPGTVGGDNPGPGTGGPSASSPAGGSQAASGNAPGTGSPNQPGQGTPDTSGDSEGHQGGPAASGVGGSDATEGAGNSAGDGGGGGGDGCVICTEMFEQGKISKKLYLSTYKAGADLSDDYLRGYHFWAVPLVNVLKKKGTVSIITFFFAERWMKHSAYTVGWVKKDNLIGYAMHKTFVPMNIVLGKIINSVGAPINQRPV